MAKNVALSNGIIRQAPYEHNESLFKKYGLIIALATMAIIMLLPTPLGLSIAGQRIIGVLLFAVITCGISQPTK